MLGFQFAVEDVSKTKSSNIGTAVTEGDNGEKIVFLDLNNWIGYKYIAVSFFELIIN